MYSDENGVQFAQSMIYDYQQELWENNWGHCPEMEGQPHIWYSDEIVLVNKEFEIPCLTGCGGWILWETQRP